MKRIELETIDITELRKIDSKANIESDLYHDGALVYKIFKDFKETEKEVLSKKERKIELLHDGPILPRGVMPIDKLVDEDIFCGYSMKYILDSQTLYSLIKKTNDFNLFFRMLLIISQNVEKIHLDARDIVLGDLHFDNILIDKDFEPYFIDLDSCGINGIPNDNNPGLLNTYRYNREIKKVDASQNSDRLCLVLCTLGLIFKYHIDFITMREFDKKAEQIETLRNMRELVCDIKKYSYMPEIPYIHEFIADSDLQSTKQIKNLICEDTLKKQKRINWLGKRKEI